MSDPGHPTAAPTAPPIATTTSASAEAGPVAEAQIYEQGYRSYDGRRTGVVGALKTLITHSVRAVLGIGRAARHKVMPFAVILLAFTPTVVFVGVAALLPGDLEEGFLPTYAEYYGFISAVLVLFAALVAPELLCTDRRTGMLGVYLASPLDRRSYLLGKTLAISSILAIVTIGPPLLLLIALSLEDAGPDTWSEGIRLGLRIIASGAVMSAFYAGVSMAVSATTDRKAAASATILGLLIGSAAVTNGLVEGGNLDRRLLLGDLLTLPSELAFRIHGEEGEWATRDIPTPLIWLTLLAIVAICAAWIWDRYRRMLVRR
ncbi:MAG: ABC transporter permease subunit [Acidimicrobiales bacterium]